MKRKLKKKIAVVAALAIGVVGVNSVYVPTFIKQPIDKTSKKKMRAKQ